MSHLNWNLIPDSQTCSWKVIRTLFAFLALILIFQMFCFLVLIFGLICCSKATLQMYTFMVFPPFFQLVSSLPIYLLTSLRRLQNHASLHPGMCVVVVGCWLLGMFSFHLPAHPATWGSSLLGLERFRCSLGLNAEEAVLVWEGLQKEAMQGIAVGEKCVQWVRSVGTRLPMYIACKFGVEATSWILEFLSSSTIIAP